MLLAGGDKVRLSSYAPADDLIAQGQAYVEEMDEIVSDPTQFADESRRARLVQDAYTLALVAVALAEHDTDNAWKQRAPAVVQAARALAAAEEHAAARQALAALKSALADDATAEYPLRWADQPLGPLMEQVGVAQTNAGRYLRRLTRTPEYVQRSAAIMALVAQRAALEPAYLDNAQWRALSHEMRDAAAELNRAARAKDLDAASRASDRLEQSCKRCHDAFQK